MNSMNMAPVQKKNRRSVTFQSSWRGTERRHIQQYVRFITWARPQDCTNVLDNDLFFKQLLATSHTSTNLKKGWAHTYKSTGYQMLYSWSQVVQKTLGILLNICETKVSQMVWIIVWFSTMSFMTSFHHASWIYSLQQFVTRWGTPTRPRY